MFAPDLQPQTLAIIGCTATRGPFAPTFEMQCRFAVKVFKVSMLYTNIYTASHEKGAKLFFSVTIVDVGAHHGILPLRGGMTGQSAPTVLACWSLRTTERRQSILSGVTHLGRLPERSHVTRVGPGERRYHVTGQSAPER